MCSGNGQYLAGACQCIQGWKGQECNIPENECAVPDCNGNGRCINGECKCYSGFKGPHCGIGKMSIIYLSLDVLRLTDTLTVGGWKKE